MRISPDIGAEQMRAIIGALDSHTAMSSQALRSPATQQALLNLLFTHADLYEALRARTTP